MDTLYTSGHLHGFPTNFNISSTSSFYNAMGSSTWGSQEGVVALGVVLGSSISLVGLAFAFITYSLFSDLRSLAGTTLLSLLATLFMSQLLFVIGVGGIQDTELCLSLSLALLFMKLASLCWICCCCHHSLIIFRKNTNISLQPEQKMGKVFAHYSLFSWGFPLLMLSVAAAFIYKERDAKLSSKLNQLVHSEHNGSSEIHCWLMHGSSYIWGFLVPASILLFVGFYLSAQLSGAVKLTAALQIDQRARNKIIKRRGLQIGLFFKLLLILSTVQIVGAIASFGNIEELWAVYSVVQGIQGLLVSMLVSCNCKILRIYAQPRGTKKRKENYTTLRDGEGGRFGILSVTNPNYENFTTSQSPSGECDQNFVKMTYKEDNFVERNENIQYQSINDKIFGDLTSAVHINEIVNGPTPMTV
ncbi:CLUMA_CG003140, isoform A [Clunio marinus]|uniref:CLUMA_CG003140, isoform A n=1 Tax=Clunio marinus TaxID=568069 RepID=A0A1J1HPC8_9DIPT|nr:CLUMA_CG003140, isoform A [Clunio marinus]